MSKKNKTKNVNLPVSYSVDSFDNERFLKLRVKVMHTGLNLNNSNFNLDVVEAARPTLANIPLLAFIKKVDGQDSNDDFAGHEYEIKITEDEMKYVYLGRPIGIIPETNNYEVETDETGKTFVSVDAYVWKDYANSALDILNRDEVKKVSMEVLIDDYEWEENYIDVKAYKYTGVALLGEDVREAMIGANAEIVKFSESSIGSMMSELKEAMAAFSAEPTVEPTVEPVVEPTVEPVIEPTVEPEPTAEPVVEPVVEPEPVIEPVVEPDMSVEPTVEPEPVIEPQADQSQDIDFEAKIAELESEIENLQAENASLLEFKAQVEQDAFELAQENLFAEFTDLDEEEISALRDQNLTLENLEIHLFALRGKKVQSKNNANPKLNIQTDYTQIIVKKEPEYADLIRQHKQAK